MPPSPHAKATSRRNVEQLLAADEQDAARGGGRGCEGQRAAAAARGATVGGAAALQPGPRPGAPPRRCSAHAACGSALASSRRPAHVVSGGAVRLTAGPAAARPVAGAPRRPRCARARSSDLHVVDTACTMLQVPRRRGSLRDRALTVIEARLTRAARGGDGHRGRLGGCWAST